MLDGADQDVGQNAKMLGEQVIKDGVLVNVIHPHITRTDRHPARIKRRAAEMGTTEAEAEAAKIQADAAAYAERATAAAEADANRSRAASLADGNQELIAASRIVEALPSLVAAAAQGIADSNLTILNGTEGVSQVVAGLVGQGLSILDTLKKSTAAVSSNGPLQAPPAAARGADRAQEPPPAQPTQADRVRQR